MKPYVQLTGEDGNAFYIIGRVSKSLKETGMMNEAQQFTERAFLCGSYEELLNLVLEYCEVG